LFGTGARWTAVEKEVLDDDGREGTEGATYSPEQDDGEQETATVRPALDVQAVLTVIGRRRPENGDARITIDLSEADLSRADLSGAILFGANLSRAKLFGANLSRANLSRADLSRADLFEADLSGSNLSGADLSRAKPIGADLSRANLSRADLSRADLFEADLSGSNLSGADLSSCLNLTLDQIRSAIIDEHTKLPPDIAEALAEEPDAPENPEKTGTG
jgi:hypothetical protein